MEKVTRFGVSMEPELLKKFDLLIDRKGYPNRSEAVRDLVRAAIIEKEMEHPTTPLVGTISFIYDHHASGINRRLTDIQHRYHHQISSTTHVHLSHDRCLEIVIVRGSSAEVRALGENLLALKGVHHGGIFTTVDDGATPHSRDPSSHG